METTVAALEPLPAVYKTPLRRIVGGAPFVMMHLACFAAIWTGVTWQAVALCIGFYWLRMFGTTGGYHRYFSHRTYKTSRWFQFALAFLAESSLQKGVLWWSAHHRAHHKYSDTVRDTHSPVVKGLFYAHVGWIFDARHDATNFSAVRDLSKFPELRFIDKFHYLPALCFGVLFYLWMGWTGVVVGGFVSTVLTWHGTFLVNSLAHVVGKRVYNTTDDSKNSAIIAFFTMGEGWHNNHHHYMLSTRQGFHWWQFDFTYYILRALAWAGIVWDLREPPREIVLGTEEALAGQSIAALPVEDAA